MEGNGAADPVFLFLYTLICPICADIEIVSNVNSIYWMSYFNLNLHFEYNRLLSLKHNTFVVTNVMGVNNSEDT